MFTKFGYSDVEAELEGGNSRIKLNINGEYSWHSLEQLRQLKEIISHGITLLTVKKSQEKYSD